MQKKSGYRRIVSWLLIAMCLPLTVSFPAIFGRRGYYLAAFVFCVLALGGVLASFEKTGPDTLKLTLIAVMCAMAVAGRMVFAAVPFVKPVAAFVIISGIMLGPQRGFMTGAVSMLVSNFMFSQGPWTVWQMFAFGVLGLISGGIFHKRPKLQKKSVIAVYSFIIYVFLCGPIMDLSSIFAYTIPGKVSLWGTLIAGLYVNIVAAVSTSVFIILLAEPVMKKLKRIMRKYGVE